jgi:hypothetical protein
MAFPTCHWSYLQGSLQPGVAWPYTHGLKVRGVAVAPDVILRSYNASGVGSAALIPSMSIECDSAADQYCVYLSNWDPSNAHTFSLVARKYHSIDGDNTGRPLPP